MNRKLNEGLRVQVKVEATFFITDAEELERAAATSVEAAVFETEAGDPDEEERDAERARVQSGPAAAAQWLAEPENVLADVAGVEFDMASWSAELLPDIEVPGPIGPDFVRIFPLCRCGAESRPRCDGVQITPRTAAVLWSAAEILGDWGYDDVVEHGDEPCQGEGGWDLFADYPRVTWREDAVWRRQAARSFHDLAGDIEAGEPPTPTCPGEEMALHMLLKYAQDAVNDGESGLETIFADLPIHDDDLDWELLGVVLFQDHDILELLDPGNDGIEDPESEKNRKAGMGDYRPSAWFKPFLNVQPRDGRRPFLR